MKVLSFVTSMIWAKLNQNDYKVLDQGSSSFELLKFHDFPLIFPF